MGFKIMNNENNEIELLKNIDYIYFATGISENIESLEF